MPEPQLVVQLADDMNLPPSRSHSVAGPLGGDPPGRSLCVCIFAPSPRRRGQRLPTGSLAMAVERLILDIADGATVLRGRGIWRDERGRVVRESVTVFETYIPTVLTVTAWSTFIQRLRVLANNWHQEAVLVIVDGRRLLIPGTRHPRILGDPAAWQFPGSWWGRAVR